MKYQKVEVPDEDVEFYRELGAVVMRDEDEMYSIFPSEELGRGHGVLPTGSDGAYFVNRQTCLTHMRLVAAASYNVAEYMDSCRRSDGCI